MQHLLKHDAKPSPWNKGKVTGQKPPLKRHEIWAIRVRLQIQGRIRDLALFNPKRNFRHGTGYCLSSSHSVSVPGMARSMLINPDRASSVME